MFQQCVKILNLELDKCMDAARSQVIPSVRPLDIPLMVILPRQRSQEVLELRSLVVQFGSVNRGQK